MTKSSAIFLALVIGVGGGVAAFLSSSNRLLKNDSLADLNLIQTRLRDSLLSIEESTKAQLAASAQQHLESLDAKGTWPDIDYKDRSRYPWKPVTHLQRVSILAQAYGASVAAGTSNYADSGTTWSATAERSAASSGQASNTAATRRPHGTA